MPSKRTDDRPSMLGMVGIILLPVEYCALPLPLASGLLAGAGSLLQSPWLIGAAIALLIAGIVIRRVRRTHSRRTGQAPVS